MRLPTTENRAHPILGLVLIGFLIILLSASFVTLPKSSLVLDYSARNEALLEYLTVYLAFVLFLICLRRFLLQNTKDVLFLGIGALSFTIVQIWQVLAVPGFHDLWWLPATQNAAIALDVLGRLLLGFYFLLAVLNVQKPLLKPTFRNTILIYLNGLALVFFLTFCVFNFLPPDLLYADRPSVLKESFDLLAAFLLLIGGVISMHGLLRERQRIYFWFGVSAFLGVASSGYAASWLSLGDVNFYAGHFLKMLFTATLLVGVLIEHFQFLRSETALSRSAQKAQDRAVQSDQNYQKFISRMANGFLVLDRKGRLSFCNRAFAKLLKSEIEELRGKHLSLFLEPACYEKIAILTSQPNELRSGYFEIDMMAQDQTKIPAGIDIVRIMNAQGQYTGAQATLTDLTTRRKNRQALEKLVDEKNQSLEVFQHCIDNSTEGLLITDAEGRITYVNRAYTKMTGFEQSRLLGKDTSTLLSDVDGTTQTAKIWKTAKDGQVWRGEITTKRRDGSHFIAELSVVPITRGNGEIINYLWVERDITRKKALEKSLEEYAAELTVKSQDLEAAKTYYETLIAGLSDILLVVDNEGNCTFLNDYAKKRLSFTAEELTRENLPIFFDDLDKLERDYGTALKLEIKDFEAPITTKEGQSILCSWNVRPLFDRQDRRSGAVAVGRDITEYKKTQEELHEYTKTLEKQAKERTRELQVKTGQLARLLEIQEEIRLGVDVDVILNKICEAVSELGWRKVVISLRDYQARVSRPVAAAGLEATALERVMNWRVPFEHSVQFFKEEFRLGNAFFIDHKSNLLNEDTPYTVYTDLGESRENEWHALDALVVPVRTKDATIGYISVDDPKSRERPSLESVHDLELLADAAALAIDNARLMHDQKESENRAKMLAEISRDFHASLEVGEASGAIVQKGSELIGEFCALFLVDKKGQYLEPQASFHPDQKVVHLFTKGTELYRVPIGQGVLSKTVTTGRHWLGSRPFAPEFAGFAESPLYYIDQKYSINHIMLMPLHVHDRRIGALVFLRIKSKVKYKKRDLGLAQDLADRAALALENARLFGDTNRKANELEKANRLKSEFLANVSHELRTPLNAIITLSDILMRGIPGNLNAEQNKQIQIIQRSGRNLLNLISDILDLSKIEAGRLEPVYAVIPLRAVIEETVEHIRPLCVGKGLRLEFECSQEVPEFLYTDQDKLTKALTNVLSNAVKFTQKGKIQVNVSVTGDASRLAIHVADTGVGIPKDRIDEIFKEFHQIDSSASRTFGGTGLGLAITRNVLTLIGGSIEVESQPGQGSTFILYLPLKLKPEKKEESTQQFEPRLSEPLEELQLELSDDRNRLERHKKAILVVDDEKEAIYMMRQYLARSRYQLIFPRNGEDAVELAKKYHPYAITLDLIMPRKSGWQVLKSLKQDAQTRDIPVIITSVLTEKDRAFEMGAAEYMVKPFDPEKLVAFLEGLDSSPEVEKVVSDFPRFLSLKRLIRSKMQGFWGRNENRLIANSTILLVDDDSDTQYAVRYILEEVGYKVFVANDGNEAVQQAESIKPSLVLMDIMMPGMDGLQATEKLKKNGKLKGIPIVAMTAKAMKGDRQKIMHAGCDDYIAKPFMSKDILKVVEKWIVNRVSNSNGDHR